MCQSMQKSFGDALEMCWKSAESNTQGRTLTNCQVAPEYRVGDKAWLSLQNYSSDCPMKKLDHKWAGPFTITKVVSPAAIKLHLSACE